MGTNAKPTTYKEKTFKEAWLSDTGVSFVFDSLFTEEWWDELILSLAFCFCFQAYPVMGVIVFAGVFCAAWGFWTMFTHPDARISKSDRKSLFRGELKSEGYGGSSH